MSIASWLCPPSPDVQREAFEAIVDAKIASGDRVDQVTVRNLESLHETSEKANALVIEHKILSHNTKHTHEAIHRLKSRITAIQKLKPEAGLLAVARVEEEQKSLEAAFIVDEDLAKMIHQAKGFSEATRDACITQLNKTEKLLKAVKQSCEHLKKEFSASEESFSCSSWWCGRPERGGGEEVSAPSSSPKSSSPTPPEAPMRELARPIGINRGFTSNCWAISFAQLYANNPSLRALIDKAKDRSYVQAELEQIFQAMQHGEALPVSFSSNLRQAFIRDRISGIDPSDAEQHDMMATLHSYLERFHLSDDAFATLTHPARRTSDGSMTETSIHTISPHMINVDVRRLPESEASPLLNAVIPTTPREIFEVGDAPEYLTVNFLNAGDDGHILKYKTPATVRLTESRSTKRYNIQSFVFHRGASAASGHYYIFTKKGDQWFRANDDRVEEVSEAEAMATLSCESIRVKHHIPVFIDDTDVIHHYEEVEDLSTARVSGAIYERS